MTRGGLAALGFALGALACRGEDVILGQGRDGLPPPAALGFSESRPLTELAAPDSADDDPSLTADLLDLYWNSERPGGAGQEDVWRASRAAPGDASGWGSPSPVPELNTELRETGIALSADGLSIWFSSDREGSLDVFTASREDRSSAWSAPSRVLELATGGDDLVSAADPSGLTLWLARRDDESDDYDVHVATRESTEAPWGPAVPVPGLDTGAAESDAFPVADGALLFTRGEDLFRAGRAGGGLGTPEPLEELNSDADDRDPWATPDLRYLVFSSDRSGSYLLYETSR